MSKYQKPFHIKLSPNYNLFESIELTEFYDREKTVIELGGINKIDRNNLTDDGRYINNGGRFDWNMFTEPDSNNPLINVELTRLWCTQMVTQMVNGKAFINEADSPVNLDLSEDEIKTTLGVLIKITDTIHLNMKSLENSLIMKKKINNHSF